MNHLTNIEVVAFDWDGTLVDSMPYKLAQNQAIAREFGRDMTIDEVRRTWNEAQGFSDLMYRLTGSRDMPEIMRVVERDYNNPAYAKREFPFAQATLQRLRQLGKKIAGITNASDEIIKMDAGNLGFDIEQDFDCFVTSDNCEYKKPDARVFNPVLGKFGVAASQLLYVGDELKDYQAATNAGAHYLGVTTGMMTTEEMAEQSIPHIKNISHLGSPA